MLTIVFCECPLRSGAVDEMFENEYRAARRAELDTLLIDHDALVDGNIAQAMRHVQAKPNPALAMYRGWMMSASQYADFYAALLEQGHELINTPDQYQRCHHLPGWYPLLQDCTPRTVWIDHLPPFSDEELSGAIAELNAASAIVKDFVKSEKQDWNEACFIPNARDLDNSRSIVEGFIARRGDAFEGGLVLRDYQRLASNGVDERTGMPLAQEWRIFLIDGEPAFFARGFETAEPTSRPQSPDVLRWGEKVDSRFFTMDVALCADDRWIVIELGDGQVAGMPELIDIEVLCRKPYLI